MGGDRRQIGVGLGEDAPLELDDVVLGEQVVAVGHDSPEARLVETVAHLLLDLVDGVLQALRDGVTPGTLRSQL